MPLNPDSLLNQEKSQNGWNSGIQLAFGFFCLFWCLQKLIQTINLNCWPKRIVFHWEKKPIFKNEITCFTWHFSRNVFQFCTKRERPWQFNFDTLIKSILECQMMSLTQRKIIQLFFISEHFFDSLSLNQNKRKMASLYFYSREKDSSQILYVS